MDKTCSNCSSMGKNHAIRHNPYSAVFVNDGCAPAKMQGLLSLNDVAMRASMSTRFIRSHLSEIPHYRASARGKIWIDWFDFQSWIQKLRVEVKQDDLVAEILRDLARKRNGSA
jgi:hypothetical protein